MEKNEDLNLKFELSKVNKRQRKVNQNVRKMVEHATSITKSMQEILHVCNNIKLPEISYEDQLIKAKEELTFVKLLPEQKVIFTELAHKICSLLPLPEVVVMGYFWRVIKEWQVNHKEPIMILMKMDPLKRIRIMDPILKTVVMSMGKSIYIPNRNLKYKFLYQLYCNLLDYYEEMNIISRFIDNNSDELLLDLMDYL